ncbi:MAG: hypothetical protein K9L02_04140 [Acholeplasmataceae bacterium]|nr:hypothetical protein [Acholeplasmataceae bacterium]
MRLFHTAVKMTLVGVIASLIAKFIGLEYWLTAGILAILSIHLTKRDSVEISSRRLIDSVFGLLLATLLFISFGYYYWIFFIFIFIFAYASWMLRIAEGIVPGLVLVTHLLQEGAFSLPMLTNELSLIFVSIGIATIFNILYPQSSERSLVTHVKSIDHLVADHLYMLALLLKDPEYNEEYFRHYSTLDRKIQEYIDIVELVDKDLLFQNDHSYLAYFHMRKEQTNYIRHMYLQALKIKKLHPYAVEIADYVITVSQDIGLYNKAVQQLRNLDVIQQEFKVSELPKTREEFEIRATLYQILIEIESLLMVKVDFHHQFPDFSERYL